MGWKDGKKPEQYLFTITEDFSDYWSTLKEKAKKDKGNISDAVKVGSAIAVKAIKAGIEKVAFDRSGYKYHGRVKALAEAAREGGLQF